MSVGHYNNKGLYNSYDKNHKERQAEDYYATPPEEVMNILNIIYSKLNVDFSNKVVLDPCVGAGHIIEAVRKFIIDNELENVTLKGSDIKDRAEGRYTNGEDCDVLLDSYPPSRMGINKVDWIVMNPPYSIIEPFMIRALEIAEKGVLMLGRIQTLEGEGRFQKIFQDNPPSDVFIYVDRIQCWKNGVKPQGSSAQGYAWFLWNGYNNTTSKIHWIRRVDKTEN